MILMKIELLIILLKLLTFEQYGDQNNHMNQVTQHIIQGY
jgi:hypothetical protein